MHEETPFSLGTITFHYAAFLSLLQCDDKHLRIILDKFVPDGENEVISEDIHRVMERLRPKYEYRYSNEISGNLAEYFPGSGSPKRGASGVAGSGGPGDNGSFPKAPNRYPISPWILQCLVNAWRYNSFGHHTEDGLVLYNRIPELKEPELVRMHWLIQREGFQTLIFQRL